MRDIEKIKTLCQSKNYNSRKYQYQIISDLTGVSPQQARRICSMQRQIRFAIPADEVGKSKAEKWRSQPIAKFVCDLNNQYKLI